MPDGRLNLRPCTKYTTEYLSELGLKKKNVIQNIRGMAIYPYEYFGPLVFPDGKAKTTKNTYSIHHYAATWSNAEEARYAREADYWRARFGMFGHKMVYLRRLLKKGDYKAWVERHFHNG